MTSQHNSPGGHYSGTSPIPNIQSFIEGLDKDKKDRDKEIDQLNKDKNTLSPSSSDETKKIVMDPTTGNEVEIEDTNYEFLETARNPKVRNFELFYFKNVSN